MDSLVVVSVGCIVILSSKSTVFIHHPLKCSLVFPKDLSLGFTYLFITALCNSIKHPIYLLFADTQNCLYDKLCNWQYTSTIRYGFHSWSVSCWLNADKTKVFTSTRKNNTINHIYKVCYKCVTHTDCIKHLRIIWVLHSVFIIQNVENVGTHTCIDILLFHCW